LNARVKNGWGKIFTRAAARLVKRAGGPLEAAVVLGSGLGETVRERIDGSAIPYGKLGAPRTTLAGHPGVAFAGTWNGKRVAAFAGRAHLYQGHSARDVSYFVHLAAAAGAPVIVLTNAAGALNPAYERGDLMLIRDHINLTFATPLLGNTADPFVNMVDAYAPHLRVLARAHTGGEALREGVYVGVVGPQYETPAEVEMLRRIGGDAVGMSTVLETIAARALGLDVLGISLVTNVAGPAEVSHDEVLRTSKIGADRVARLVENVIGAL
jgi:purine-nucleoside phosphorylase